MSLETDLRCEGAPRDLGNDVGRVHREAIRSRVGQRGLGRRIRDRFGFPERSVAAWRRDLRRYFPHQSEWLEGLARAVDLPVWAVARCSMSVLESGRAAPLVAAELEGRWRIWRGVPASARARRIEPEGRFASLELAAAVATTPWIGVNDRGLAVAIAGDARPQRGLAGHGGLFARDCLERFESLESALGWCEGRPAAPGARLLLADAAGAMAGIRLDSESRPVRYAEAGVLVLSEDLEAGNALADRLRKLRSDPAAFEAELRSSLLGSDATGLAEADPSARRLSLEGAAADLA